MTKHSGGRIEYVTSERLPQPYRLKANGSIHYSMSFLVLWSAFLFLYWQIGFPLGIQGGYEYAIPAATAP